MLVVTKYPPLITVAQQFHKQLLVDIGSLALDRPAPAVTVVSSIEEALSLTGKIMCILDLACAPRHPERPARNEEEQLQQDLMAFRRLNPACVLLTVRPNGYYGAITAEENRRWDALEHACRHSATMPPMPYKRLILHPEEVYEEMRAKHDDVLVSHAIIDKVRALSGAVPNWAIIEKMMLAASFYSDTRAAIESRFPLWENPLRIVSTKLRAAKQVNPKTLIAATRFVTYLALIQQLRRPKAEAAAYLNTTSTQMREHVAKCGEQGMTRLGEVPWRLGCLWLAEMLKPGPGRRTIKEEFERLLALQDMQ